MPIKLLHVVLIFFYYKGVLSEIDDFGSVEDVTDALGTILLESHEEATQELVNKVCATLFSSLKGLVTCVLPTDRINM